MSNEQGQAVRSRITLTGAQVTRVRECLTRFNDNCRTREPDNYSKTAHIPPHMATEDLVNDILDLLTESERR